MRPWFGEFIAILSPVQAHCPLSKHLPLPSLPTSLPASASSRTLCFVWVLRPDGLMYLLVSLTDPGLWTTVSADTTPPPVASWPLQVALPVERLVLSTLGTLSLFYILYSVSKLPTSFWMVSKLGKIASGNFRLFFKFIDLVDYALRKWVRTYVHAT